MPLRIFILITVSIISINLFSQKILPNFSDCNSLSTMSINEKEFTLVVVSLAGCGPCEKSLRHLNSYIKKSSDNLRISILVYGKRDLIERLNSSYFNTFQFIHANSCDTIYHNNKFFPTYYLYSKENLIWKKKGYNDNLTKILSKKIKKASKP